MPGVPTVTVTSTLLSSGYATNEKPIDMHTKMFENYPELTPLTAILTRLSSRETSQSRVDWTEQEEMPTRVVVTADASAGAATLTIGDHFTYLRNHDFLYNPSTFEVIKIDAYTVLDSTVDVIRGWGSTDGAAITAGTILEVHSASYTESSEEAWPRQVVNTNFYNFTAEIVESVRTSRRVMNEATWFAGKGGKRLENQQKMWRLFKLKFEKSLLFSHRADLADVKTMGGIVEKLRNGSNYLDVNGILTETILDDWLTDLYAEFPDAGMLTAVVSPRVYNAINHIAKPLIRLSPNSKEYGMQLKQYEGAVKLDLIPHPLLNHPTTRGWMFVLDMSQMKLVYQQKTILELDVAPKRNKYIEDQYYTLATMIIANERRHGMAVNIQG